MRPSSYKRKAKEYGFPISLFSYIDTDEKGMKSELIGFSEIGYDADAFVNFLALLAWNPGTTQEFFSMEELIDAFSLERVHNSGAMFDIEKLKNFNAHYLRSRYNSTILEHIIDNVNFPKEGSHFSHTSEEMKAIVDIAKVRSIFSKDLYGHVSYFFEPIVLKDDVVLKNDFEFRKVMEAMTKGYLTKESSISDNWNADFIKHDLESFCESFGFKIGKVLPDLRIALTGGIPGPELPLTMELLGRDESIRRIKNLLGKTEKVAS